MDDRERAIYAVFKDVRARRITRIEAIKRLVELGVAAPVAAAVIANFFDFEEGT